jgi:phi13 family phage major tail protein
MATVGLKNLYFATLTSDGAGGVVYGSPRRIAGAVQVDVNPSISFSTLYGDDAPFAADSSMSEISVTIESCDLTLEDQATLLGHTVDTTTKQLIAKASDSAPYVALMFEAKKHNGATRYVKLLKGKFAPTQETLQTKGESVQYTTPKLEGRFVAREYDGVWKRTADSDNSESASVIASWYTSVEPA